MKEITEKMLDKKCFIFDIDGTVVDSMPMWSKIDQMAIFSATGLLVPADEIKAFRDSIIYSPDNIGGDIYSTYFGALINLFGLEMTVDEYKQFRHENADKMSREEVDFKPGADRFLKTLKVLGKKIAITTTTSKGQLKIYSEQNEKMKKSVCLNKIADVIVALDDVEKKKPDPEAYLKTIERLGAKPEECIVFEDSLNGIMAAKAAGLEVCAVFDESARSEQDVIDKLVDFKVESFDKLIKILGLDKISNQPE